MSLREALTVIFGTFLLSAGAGLIVVTPSFVIGNVEQAPGISSLFGIVLLFGVGYFRALDRDFFSKVIIGFASSRQE